jgi:hypothetical protein
MVYKTLNFVPNISLVLFFLPFSQRLSSNRMAPPEIPPECVYCVKAGKKHFDLFSTIVCFVAMQDCQTAGHSDIT